MLLNHIHERRAAGSRHLFTFLICLSPLESLICCRHIAAKPDLYHISKSDLFEGGPPASHRDIRSKFSLTGRSHHCDHLFPCLNGFDNLRNIYLGRNRAKRAASYTGTALDTLFLINLADAGLRIHRNCVNRAGTAAGTNQLSDCIIRTGLRTFTALLTLAWINVGTVSPNRNRSKVTCVLTRLSHTFLAVIRYNKTCNRTFLTCR